MLFKVAQRKLDSFGLMYQGEEDNEKDNVASKDKNVVSLKKHRVFQRVWQSKCTWLAYDTDKKIMTCKIMYRDKQIKRLNAPLKLLRGPYFSRKGDLGLPKTKSW